MLNEKIRTNAVRHAELLGDMLEEYIRVMAASRHWKIDIWTTDHVCQVREDLNEEQAWEVLQDLERTYDATLSMQDWMFNRAEALFGLPPDEEEDKV